MEHASYSPAVQRLIEVKREIPDRETALADPEYLAAAWAVVEENYKLILHFLSRSKAGGLVDQYRDELEPFMAEVLFNCCWPFETTNTFATYAMANMRFQLKAFLSDKDRERLPLRLPKHLSRAAVKRWAEKLIADESAERWSSQRVQAMLNANSAYTDKRVHTQRTTWGDPGEQYEGEPIDPIDQVLGFGDSPFDDPVGDEVSDGVSMLRLYEWMATELSIREERVLKMRFGMPPYEPHTLDQIGIELNLSRERIRQIERKALARLRANAREHEVTWQDMKVGTK